MLELFIELTNQIFWDGYAQQLSTDNPSEFRSVFKEFSQSYNQQQQAARPLIKRPSAARSLKKMAHTL